MSILIKELIEKDESDRLDFKRDQYPFIKASELKKSELLKDILAFSNSLKLGEKAYIVIGIQEVKGARNIVWGTEEHFDDAQIQQFINYKTNREVNFSYQVHLFEGKKIGIICILQPKFPIYVNKKDYGIVKKEVIYYRSSSDTRNTTDPDQIARMAIERDSLPANTRLEYNLEEPKTVDKQVLRRNALLGFVIIILVGTLLAPAVLILLINLPIKFLIGLVLQLAAIIFFIQTQLPSRKSQRSPKTMY